MLKLFPFVSAGLLLLYPFEFGMADFFKSGNWFCE
jgi:hypothetical protein